MKFLLLSVLVLFLSCQSNDNELFDMNIEADFTIRAGLSTLDTHYFLVRRVPTRIKNYLGSVDPEAIQKILPRKAVITAPFENIDFGIVREVSIWVISTKDPDVKKEIFYQDRINLNDQNELKLFSSLSEVKEILLEDQVDLEIRFNFRTFTPTEINTRITMNFLVDGIK